MTRRSDDDLYGVRCYIGPSRVCTWPWVWCKVAPRAYADAERIARALNDNVFKSPATAYAVARAGFTHPLWHQALGTDQSEEAAR